MVFEIEVARALRISEDGQHVITSPPSIDFIDPLRASLETATNLQVSFQRPYVVNPTEEGVLYIMVTDGGSGFTGNPTITVSGGGGTGATATSVHAGGVLTRIALDDRGTGYTSVPTVTVSGGGGSGATARAYFGTFSTIMQDFSDNADTSLFATAHFDLERALDETFDGDRMCQVSFNVGDPTGMAPRLRAVLYPTVSRCQTCWPFRQSTLRASRWAAYSPMNASRHSISTRHRLMIRAMR